MGQCAGGERPRVFLGTKHAIPAMRAAGGGSIINISSIAGIVGSPYGMAAYSASKGAVRVFSKLTAVQQAKTRYGATPSTPAL